MSGLSLAAGNEPLAEKAANDMLALGGSAVAAVLAGYFAAAGSHSGVLLSPTSLLVGGIGSGARAFDGRLRQPGLGTKRPRGFLPDEPVPQTARVAVPAGFVAAMVALAYEGTGKLGSIMKPALAAAKGGGAEGRVELLQRIRAMGAAAFSEPSFVRPLLRVAGPSEGGLLTSEDFAKLDGLELDAVATERDGRALYEVPWAAQEPAIDEGAELGIGFVIAAFDPRGACAALTYRRVGDGFTVDDLELEAPLAAVPVLRHVERRAPGTPLPAPMPVALLRGDGGLIEEVIARPTAERLGSIADVPLRLRRDPVTRTVTVIR